LPSKEATPAGVETAPPDIIADIKVNAAAEHVLVPTTSGRVIPIGCGVVPFGSADIGWHLSRIITGKGSWATGSRERAQVDLGEPFIDSHIGLLSVEGARGEQIISKLSFEFI
jgi:hypothetical protein